MKLSDAVSAMHLSLFAEIPLVIFLGIFLGVVLHLFSGRERFEHARHLPLEPNPNGNNPEPLHKLD